MPVKKTESKPAKKIPNFSNSKLYQLLPKINVVWILVVLLILASFLIGVLVTKVTYLEKGSTTTAAGDQQIGDNLAPQAPSGPVDVAVGHLPPLGDKDAPVTIVEFSDFQCPFCKSLFDNTLPQIKKDYIDTGKAKFYYRHFPLTSIHPNAQLAAEASECANDQDKFWEYHDQLFINQTQWELLSEDEATAKFTDYAGSTGISVNEFSDCLTSGKFADSVNEDLNDGTAAGVDGTPGTFINGYLTVGAVPYEQFKAEIEARLEEAN